MAMSLQRVLPGDVATVDISDELMYLRRCQQAFLLPQAVLQQIVIDAKGSLPLSLSRMQSCLHAHDVEACGDVWLDGGACSSLCQQMTPEQISTMSEWSRHQDIGLDDAVPRIQDWYQEICCNGSLA